MPKQPTLEFTPSKQGPEQDWVLVIDDAAESFGAPGAKKK
jgi:hypothetical protein